jgi:glycosyltransferase involved in cell wall biosynthesis
MTQVYEYAGTVVKTALALKNLPEPPKSKVGWPWTEQGDLLPEHMPDGSEWPLISVVTPSFNQGQFIEETIRSVLLQGYPNVEYIIIDGGSTDNTVEIIKKYERFITYWVSESDRGQSHALNKGFRRAGGELVGWQNSDDFYHSKAFRCAALKSRLLPEVDVFYGQTDLVDTDANFIRPYPVSEFDIHQMLPYPNLCNQSIFIRKSVFQQGFFIDESYHHAMDQEFFLRLALRNYQFLFVPEIKAYFRIHENTKGNTQDDVAIRDGLRIFTSIIQNKSLPLSLREKSATCIYGFCIYNFGVLKFDIFRESFFELVRLNQFKYLKFPLLLRYVLHFLGEANVKRLQSLKNRYGGKFGAKNQALFEADL